MLPLSETRRYLGTVMYLKLLLGLIGVGIVIGIAATLPFHTSILRVMIVLGPGLLFASLNSLTLVFRAHTSYIYLLIVSLTTAVLGIGSALFVSYLNGDIIAFAAVQTGTQICAGVLTIVLCLVLFKPDLRLRMGDLKTLFVVAVPIGIAMAVNILYYRIDVPLLGLLSTNEEVAKYASTYRFLDVLTLLPASLQAATLPQMSALLKRSLGELRDFAQHYLEIAATLGSFIGVLLSFLAVHALDIVYAGRYNSAASILQVLAWAGTATLLTNVFVPLTIVLDKSRALLIVSTLGLIVNVSINIVFIPTIGALAAAYATLITEGVVIVCLGWVVLRALKWRIHLVKLASIAVITAIVAWAGQTAILQHLAWPIGGSVLAALWLLLTAPVLVTERKAFSAVFTRGRKSAARS